MLEKRTMEKWNILKKCKKNNQVWDRLGGRILIYLHLLRYVVDEAGPAQALRWLCLYQHRLAMSFAGGQL